MQERFKAGSALALLLGCTLLSGPSLRLHAQSTTEGAIGGTVEDQSGAAVAGAAVAVHNDDTNAETHATANDSGSFKADQLTPGTYTVTITAPNFETFIARAVTVALGQQTEILPHLTAGGSTQVVEVSGQAPLLNFENPDFSSNLQQAPIDNLPLNGLRWSTLALLTPGVVSDSSGFGLLSIRGTSPLLNNVEIDGADDNQAFFSEERGRTREGYSTPQVAIQEFQVNSGVYSTEYGRALGGVINSVTKSGGNDVHGEAYFFDRDNDWGAINPFTKLTVQEPGTNTYVSEPFNPKDVRKRWGFGAGGPIIKDKLFWFYTYDQYARNFPGIARVYTPGTFFATPDATLPAGSTCSAAGLTALGKASAIDQGACLLTLRLGLPNYSAGAALYSTDLTQLNALLGFVPRQGNQIVNMPKLDWQVNARNHVSFLYNRLGWDSPAGIQTSSSVEDGVSSFGNDFVKLDYGLAKLDTTITTNIVNEVRYQYGRELDDEFSQKPTTYEQQFSHNQFGFPPNVSLLSSTTGFSFGTPAYLQRVAYPDERKWQVADTVTWLRGNHTIKIGEDIVHNYDLENNLYSGNGSYSYTTGSTLANYFSDLNKPSGTCSAAKSGTVSATGIGTTPCYTSFTQGFGPAAFDLATTDYGAFIQDNWKLSPRLTLELGVRYDYEQIPGPYKALYNPAVPGTANKPEDGNNIGPRVGFSYDVYGHGQTVLRGGYGLYYGRIFNGDILTTYQNTASTAGQVTYTYKAGYAGAPTFANIFNGTPQGTAGTTAAGYFSSGYQNPSGHEFDLSLQQQLAKNTVFALSYLGSLSRQLPSTVVTNLGGLTNETLTVGPSSTGNYGPLGNATFTVPTYTGFTSGSAAIYEQVSNGNASYNAVVAEVKNAANKYVTFDANYTWSHALDYNQNEATTGLYDTNYAYDPNGSQRIGYGNSSFNVPNRFVGWALIDLPGVSKGWEQTLLNGWDLYPLVQIQNGLPYSATVSSYGAGILSGLNGSGVSPNFLPQIGRNTLKLRASEVFDLRVQKQFTIKDKYHLQLVGDGFNMFNHVNYTAINSTAYQFSGNTLEYQSNYGTYSNANNNITYTPRQVQISAKFQF
jgi:outer membrane receptor protein involved in Fe transport